MEGQEEEGQRQCDTLRTNLPIFTCDLSACRSHQLEPTLTRVAHFFVCLWIRVCMVLQGGAEGSAWGRASKRAVATHAASPPKHKQPPPQSQVSSTQQSHPA